MRGHAEDTCYLHPELAHENWKGADSILKKIAKKKKNSADAKREKSKTKDKPNSDDFDVLTIDDISGTTFDTANSAFQVSDSIILDSDASQHLFNTLDHFIDIDMTAKANSIKAGGGQPHKIHGLGKIELTMRLYDGTKQYVTISGVHYVPTYIMNLLSTTRLKEKDISFDTGTETLRRMKDGAEFGCTVTSNGL